MNKSILILLLFIFFIILISYLSKIINYRRYILFQTTDTEQDIKLPVKPHTPIDKIHNPLKIKKINIGKDIFIINIINIFYNYLIIFYITARPFCLHNTTI